MRISTYTAVVRDDGYLLHNTLHNTMLKVNNPEFKRLIDSISERRTFLYKGDNEYHNLLMRQKMIVDDNVKEYQLVDYLAKRMDMDRRTLAISMVVTRDCNFKCLYCFEEAEPRAMSWDIYEQSVDAIVSLVQRLNYSHVSITLYGGEPTLEHENYCRFMELLRTSLPDSVDLDGLIITNGYLLDMKIFRELLELGIKRFQVTVDGFEKTHDSSRMMKDGSGTWEIVVSNLLAIKDSDANFDLKIKTLYTDDMIENIDKWFVFLKGNFGDDKRFSFQFDTVRDGREDTIGLYDFDFISDIRSHEIEQMTAIINKSVEHGLALNLYKNKIKPMSIKCSTSMMDCFSIDVDGTLKKCNMFLDSSYVGRIVNNEFEFDEQRMADYTSYELRPSCKTCFIYPICHGKKCATHYYKHYYGEDCRFFRARHKLIMRALYASYENSKPVASSTQS